MPSLFGEFCLERRRNLGLTLREFCRKHGYDPALVSRWERGVTPPPRDKKKREKYARALGLESDSAGWREFFDLADACSGRIPKDIVEDEELLRKVPIVFRTVRGADLDEKGLKRLLKTLRRELG